MWRRVVKSRPGASTCRARRTRSSRCGSSGTSPACDTAKSCWTGTSSPKTARTMRRRAAPSGASSPTRRAPPAASICGAPSCASRVRTQRACSVIRCAMPRCP
ncbi:uncharacterized protein MRET_2928 [Malassezia restricta]|uniref:uncharacterized protein n=1 Tax=Malassezia restricta TaxID=76775 RepID=UPI000DD133E3|nr:uncharacterized protein MRET_2928 [Malassezia restricta]AXA50968.1 uncharacterized protein MRET_2928 [Malassezia restricta]